ncbi:MAG: regulatory protein RecX [Betaproteobacteria bacterium]
MRNSELKSNCGLRPARETERQIGTSGEKELSRARNAAYRFLTSRPRSRAEVKAKLLDKGFPEAVVRVVLIDLERLGYVNDREFSRSWAQSRARVRGLGRRRIEHELRNKGISRDIIQETLSDVFGDLSEVDIAQREAGKKFKSLARFDPEVRRRRLAGFLERKGFSPEIIHTILRTVAR